MCEGFPILPVKIVFESFACAYCISILFPSKFFSLHRRMSQLQVDQLVEEARRELAIVGMQLPTNPMNYRIVIQERKGFLRRRRKVAEPRRRISRRAFPKQ